MGTSNAQYVVNSLKLPTGRTENAEDLNGDGREDNQLGNIVGALASQNLGTQAQVDEAVAEGKIVLLIDQSSTDPTFAKDSCGASSIKIGKSPATKPTFNGSDTFMVDTSVPSGDFKGAITASTFRSNSPITTKTPVTYTLGIPLISGSAPIELSITGAYLQYTRTGDGVMAGQINGAIKNEDVQTKIIPTIATLLNTNVQKDPTSSTNKQILSIFDTGGAADAACSGACKNPDGTCAVKADGKIDTCEVSTNSIIANVLAPDVQMFDAAGNYAPNKDNKMRDSLSLGLGFTAVKASF